LVENTIREIKEAQADKEKTKAIRKEFEQNKANIEKDAGAQNKQLNRRIKGFKNATKRHKIDISNEQPQQEQKETIEIGDAVRISGQDTIGEVIELNEKNAVVAFGAFITSVDRNKLERTSKNERRKQQKRGSSNLSNTIIEKQNNFKPGIDIRGKYVDEALQIITDYIDEAIMLNVNEVKILHGTGSGILRKAVREYLNTLPEVQRCKDEHIEFGGAGITVVQFKKN
jgi:DNA mismatch repair protein MutS2